MGHWGTLIRVPLKAFDLNWLLSVHKFSQIDVGEFCLRFRGDILGVVSFIHISLHTVFFNLVLVRIFIVIVIVVIIVMHLMNSIPWRRMNGLAVFRQRSSGTLPIFSIFNLQLLRHQSSSWSGLLTIDTSFGAASLFLPRLFLISNLNFSFWNITYNFFPSKSIVFFPDVTQIICVFFRAISNRRDFFRHQRLKLISFFGTDFGQVQLFDLTTVLL